MPVITVKAQSERPMGKRQRSIINHTANGGADNKITLITWGMHFPSQAPQAQGVFLCKVSPSLWGGLTPGPMRAISVLFLPIACCFGLKIEPEDMRKDMILTLKLSLF
jgi:hypothetical protein